MPFGKKKDPDGVFFQLGTDTYLFFFFLGLGGV